MQKRLGGWQLWATLAELQLRLPGVCRRMQKVHTGPRRSQAVEGAS